MADPITEWYVKPSFVKLIKEFLFYHFVFAVTDGSWCSSNAECDANELCKDINLSFIKIKRCRCMKGFEQKDPWENCAGY